jgi:hypothetical protein
MRDLARDAHLIAKSDQHRFADLRRGQKLERHGLIQDQVVGAVHLAHAALSQQAENAVTSRQHRAGGEPAFFRTAR